MYPFGPRVWAFLLLVLFGCSKTRKPAPPPPPAASPISSANVVRCGGAKCEVPKEKCCRGKISSCQARRDTDPEMDRYCDIDSGQSGEGESGALLCENAANCPAPERCCWNAADSANTFTSCRSGGCDLSTACLTDSDCPSGFRCNDVTPSDPGSCVLRDPHTVCGNEVCRGTTPVCCYDESTHTTRCSAEADRPCARGDELGFAIRCQSPEECGGERCCALYQTYCAASCINSSVVCQKDSDCPKEEIGMPLTGCRPTTDPQQPPWFKLCTYDQSAAPPAAAQ